MTPVATRPAPRPRGGPLADASLALARALSAEGLRTVSTLLTETRRPRVVRTNALSVAGVLDSLRVVAVAQGRRERAATLRVWAGVAAHLWWAADRRAVGEPLDLTEFNRALRLAQS